ncbi:Protein 21.1 [Giardia lamblia P15]|uniref:Protein 21.1 n=1 Tax=Giardia intestinalis (strain P15) TaxID=658858 RepID=E1F0F7_GIAIA|nr:Protein 21.1 [Giardia lamblia P15]
MNSERSVSLHLWFSAASNGNTEFLKRHIEVYKGKLNEAGLTALALAISSSQFESAAYLSEHEATVRLAKRQTPLMLAASLNRIDILPLLHATYGWQDEDGKTALMYAVLANNALASVKHLAPHEHGIQSTVFEVTTDDLDLFDRQMESLQYVTPYFLFEDAMVDAVTALTRDKTALHMAVLAGNVDAFSVLLPLEYSIANANKEYFTMLLSRLDPDTAALFCPSMMEHVDLIRSIFGAKSSSIGKTALLYAISERNIPLIKFFSTYELQHSITEVGTVFPSPDQQGTIADSTELIEKRTYKGFTPFHYAALAGDQQIISILLNSVKRLGIVSLVEQTDDLGRTPLHIAASLLNFDYMEEYLAFASQNMLKLNIQDAQGFSPIDYAIVSPLFGTYCAEYRAAALKRRSHASYNKIISTEVPSDVSTAFSKILDSTISIYQREKTEPTSLGKKVTSHLVLAVSRFNCMAVGSISKYCDAQQLNEALLEAAKLCFNEVVPHLLGDSQYTGSAQASASLFAATCTNGPFRLLFPRNEKARNERGETALMLACKARCFANALIAVDAEATLKTYNGETALMFLASLGELSCEDEQRSLYRELSERLISAEKGSIDVHGYTALMYAAKTNALSLVHQLLRWEYGHAAFDQLTSLAVAAQHGNVQVVETMLAYEKDKLFSAEQDKAETKFFANLHVTALMLAAGRPNNSQVCQLLAPIQAGIQDQTGSTALMYAVKNGHPANANVLASYEHSKIDEKGYSALMYAIDKNQTSSILSLIEYERGSGLSRSTGQTAMILVVQSKVISIGSKLQYVKELIGKEGGVQDKSKRTALMYAIESGEEGSDQLALLLAKYEKGRQMADGTSALMLAVKHEMYNVALALAASEVGLTTNTGYTALMYLSAGKNPYLLVDSKKADYDQLLQKLVLSEARKLDNDRCTALMLAVTHRNIRVIKELLPYETKQTNARGETMLMYAAEHNMVEIVELLADYEAGMRDKDGENALIHACKAGMVDAAIILAKCPAEVDCVPRDGVEATPMMIAAECGLSSVVIALKQSCVGFVCTKGPYSGYSALGLAIKGGHETIVKLLYDEIPLCMGLQHGAIELCIRFKREGMLLWILEYCSRHNKLETTAKSTCFPKSIEVQIPETSLVASYSYGSSVGNVQIMHLSVEMLGEKAADIQYSKPLKALDARFYALLLHRNTNEVLACLKKRWTWILEAIYRSVKEDPLLPLLVDQVLYMLLDDIDQDEPHAEPLLINRLEGALHELSRAFREYEIDSCCVCMDADADVIFFPCKHMIACESCAKGLTRCPYCRTIISEIFNPYFLQLTDNTKHHCVIL